MTDLTTSGGANQPPASRSVMNLITSGRIGLGVVSQLLLIAAFGFAIMDKDQQLQLLITGAIIANATSVINWFFGSSSGSERKDDTIAAAATAARNGSNVVPFPPTAPPAPTA